MKKRTNTLLKLEKPYIYGTHAVHEALRNPRRRFKKLYATAEALRNFAPPVPFQEVLKEDLCAALGDEATHQGLVLETYALPHVHLEDALQSAPQVCQILVLDQISDPHNVGAIARSAAAFGVHAIIQQDKNAPELSSPVIAKVACGGIEHLSFITVPNLSRALQQLQHNDFWVMGLDEAGESTVQDTKLTGRIAFVMGREGEGLRRLVKETCDQLVRLPTSPVFSTLNVSNAAAVTLYEWVRQNGGVSAPRP